MGGRGAGGRGSGGAAEAAGAARWCSKSFGGLLQVARSPAAQVFAPAPRLSPVPGTSCLRTGNHIAGVQPTEPPPLLIMQCTGTSAAAPCTASSECAASRRQAAPAACGGPGRLTPCDARPLSPACTRTCLAPPWARAAHPPTHPPTLPPSPAAGRCAHLLPAQPDRGGDHGGAGPHRAAAVAVWVHRFRGGVTTVPGSRAAV